MELLILEFQMIIIGRFTYLMYLCWLLVILSSTGCNDKKDSFAKPDPVAKLYTSKSKRNHLKQLSEDYRLYFRKIEGSGINKEILSKMLDWDYNLNASKKILDTAYLSKDSIVLLSHEENDFSRLIGFPGWKSENTFTITDNKIDLQLYKPVDEINYKPYLEPAIHWLLENDSLGLIKIYNLQKGLLIQDSIAAGRWVKLLTKWKMAKKDSIRAHS